MLTIKDVFSNKLTLDLEIISHGLGRKSQQAIQG
jgi:hypothetical protein